MIKIKNKLGTITISGAVLTILTGDAATNCFGVKGMALRNVSDGIVYLLKMESMGKGVNITYDDDGRISVSLNIVVDRGVNIPVVCSSIMDQVRYMLSEAAGVEVKNIDIYIDTMTIN